jgi:hypothetical protein
MKFPWQISVLTDEAERYPAWRLTVEYTAIAVVSTVLVFAVSFLFPRG